VLVEVGEDRVDGGVQLLDPGGHCLGAQANRLAEQGDIALGHRGEEVLLVAEQIVERADGDLGAFGDLVDRGAVVAALGQHRFGGVEDDRLAQRQFPFLA
jgi:hypothetical protein